MNVFTSKFQMAMMEANALIPLFYFTSKVEENNHGAKDNYVNLVNSIVAIIKNYLYPYYIPFRVATRGGSTIVSSSGKVFRLKQQITLKQKKLS